MGALLGYLRRAGIERGLLGGRRGWMILGLTAWGVRFLQRAAHRDEQVVYQEELAPGESLIIRREAFPSRGRRRKQS